MTERKRATWELLPPVNELLIGKPFGEVFPPTRPADPLDVDGRTAAMNVLAKYLSELRFAKTGDVGGCPIPFRVEPDSIVVDWNASENDVRIPGIVIRPKGEAEQPFVGLGNYVLEETRDVFGKGTVLLRMSEQREEVAVELWASSKAERRALKATVENALNPTEQMSGVFMRLPEYFGSTARYTMTASRQANDRSGQDRFVHEVGVLVEFAVLRIVSVAEYLGMTCGAVFGAGSGAADIAAFVNAVEKK